MLKSYKFRNKIGLSLWLIIVIVVQNFIPSTLLGPTFPKDSGLDNLSADPNPISKREKRPSNLEKGGIDWQSTNSHIADLYLKYQNGILNYRVRNEQTSSSFQKTPDRRLRLQREALDSDQNPISIYEASVNATLALRIIQDDSEDETKSQSLSARCSRSEKIFQRPCGIQSHSSGNSSSSTLDPTIHHIFANSTEKNSELSQGIKKVGGVTLRSVRSLQKMPRSLESVADAIGRKVAQLKDAAYKTKSAVLGAARKVKDAGNWVIDQPGKIKDRISSFFSTTKEKVKQAEQKVANVPEVILKAPSHLKETVQNKFQDVKDDTSHLKDLVLNQEQHSRQRRVVQETYPFHLQPKKMKRMIRAEMISNAKRSKTKLQNFGTSNPVKSDSLGSSPDDTDGPSADLPQASDDSDDFVATQSSSTAQTESSRNLSEIPMKVFIPTRNKSGGGKVPLVDHQGLLWYGLIQIGNPAKTFRLDFDTGSADLWIPSTHCDSCSKKSEAYNPVKSTTSRAMDGVFLDLKYGDGSTTAGHVYRDTVTVAGLTASQQAFSAASHVGQTFRKDPIDGVLGLAYRSLSAINESPFFETLVSQKRVPHPVFSFKLAGSDSHLYLGGADRASYRGDFEWYPVLSKSYWVLLARISVNSRPAISRIRAVIDTGTSIIVAPSKQADLFWSQVPGSQPHSENEGYYTYPCHQAPTVDFSFGDSADSKQWKITASDLRLGTTGTRSSKKCIGSIVGKDIGLDAWILGDTFLKNVYSTFDIVNHRVGFATLA